MPALRPSTPTRHQTWLAVEPLELRDVPSASLTLGEAVVREQGNLAPFVTGNVAVLEHPSGMTFGPDRTGDAVADLYVVGRLTDNVVVYDGQTGGLVGQAVTSGSGFDNSAWIVFGPDGDLFTSTFTSTGKRDSILRATPDGLVTTFVSNDPVANGGLDGAKGMAHGPDGNLYVASANTDQVLRYDGATGTLVGAYVPVGSGGLDSPAAILFGPDRDGDGVSDLYVGSNLTDEVLVYDGADGSPLGAFVAAGSGGLDGPHDMAFGPDGNLYVVASASSYERVLRFDGATGAFIDTPVPTGSGLAAETAFIAFDQEGNLFVSGEYANEVRRLAAGPLVTLSEPAAGVVTVEFSTAGGTATPGADYGPIHGRFTFAPGETSRRILVAPADDGAAESHETFTALLSNASGAAIADGQGTVTIANTDTKFFVVDDGLAGPANAADRTHEYEGSGASVVATNLDFGNTAPRGAASNAAGTTVWVADANRTVYVYDARGARLGSWSASGLPSNAQVEGIATNGTDVWLLDSGSDRVFKFTNAAGRLSGSQGPASNFKLASADSNAKGIVTDGVSFWVVDDGATSDKVFKYTLTGSSRGSWTISSANSRPTGLTINPANVSDIWIVDSGTDSVYQYAAAVGRTSGSQSAAATFALAPGNTNPQDIADPPPSASEVARPVVGVRIFARDDLSATAPDQAPPPVLRSPTALPTDRPPVRALAASRADVPPERDDRPDLAGWIPADVFDFAPIDVSLPGTP